VRDEANVILKTEKLRKEEKLLAKDINESSSSTAKNKKKLEETKSIEAEGKEGEEETEMNEEATCEDSLLSSFERNAQGMYQHSREDSAARPEDRQQIAAI